MQIVRINFTYKRKTLKRGIEPHQQGCKKFKIKKKTNAEIIQIICPNTRKMCIVGKKKTLLFEGIYDCPQSSSGNEVLQLKYRF
jgi:hypothetical protein